MYMLLFIFSFVFFEHFLLIIRNKVDFVDGSVVEDVKGDTSLLSIWSCDPGLISLMNS